MAQCNNRRDDIKKDTLKDYIRDITLGTMFSLAAPVLIAVGIHNFVTDNPVLGIASMVSSIPTFTLGGYYYYNSDKIDLSLNIRPAYDDFVYGTKENKQAYLLEMNEKYNKEIKEYFNLRVKGIN